MEKEDKFSFLKGLIFSYPIFLWCIIYFIYYFIKLIIIGNYPESVSYFLVNVLLASIIAGFFEEIFMRAGVQDYLINKKIKPFYGILLASTIFGLFHITNYFVNGNFIYCLIQSIAAICPGILFGVIYYKTKNIMVPIFVHFFYDFAVMFSQSGLSVETTATINLNINSIIQMSILPLYFLISGLLLYKFSNIKKNYILLIFVVIFNLLFFML